MITINPELQSLVPPLTPEEYAQLEANILADGCHDPLIAWQEEQTLLDGHNRLDICQRHGLPYTTEEVSLADLDAAKAWMIANQLGRRNLTPEQISYFRGKQYVMQVQQGKRTDLTSRHSGEKFTSPAATLAARHKVGERTIERDGAYARAIDAIAEVAGPEARQALLARETKLTHHEVKQLADVAQVSPPTVQQVMAGVRHATTPQVAKQMVHLAVEAVQREGATGGNGQALVLEPEPPEAADRPAEGHRNRWGSVTEPPSDTPSASPRRVYSGDCEWYTPPEVVDLIRQVLGTIDVDPASCAAAQEVVKARTYYTIEDDGLRHAWRGTVFCNPPYQMPEIARFCGKLIEELDAQHTTAAILLTNSVTDTAWFHHITPRVAAICFTSDRLKFVHATREGLRPCQGQAILYFGPQVERFAEVFGTMGLLMQVLGAKTAGPQLDLAEVPTAPGAQDAPVTRKEAGSLIMAVWLVVKKLQPCTCAQVAKALDEKRKRVHQALQALIKQEKVSKDGLHYSVVDASKSKASG
jgi:hypothetical protein